MSASKSERPLAIYLLYFLLEGLFLFGLLWAARSQTHTIEDRLELIADLRDPSPFRAALLGELEKVYLSTVSHVRHTDPTLLDQITQGESEFEKSLPQFQKQNPRLLP